MKWAQSLRDKLPSRPESKRNVVIALVIVLVGVIAFIVVWQIRKQDLADNNIEQVTSSSGAQTYQASSDEIRKAENRLAQAQTKEDKLRAYQELSNLYIYAPTDKTKAISYARDMIALEPSASSYAQLGFAAEAVGEYKTAADAYAKAMELTDPATRDDARGDYQYYQMKQKEMEKKS